MHKISTTLVSFLIFTLVSSAFAYTIVMKGYDSYDYAYNDQGLIKPRRAAANDESDLINVFTPKANQTIKSPLIVEGEARGNWYFEASFPVRLYDANNQEITLTPSYIMATGEWMTTDFVPFKATLNFNTPATPTGTLVLEKDNPSGEAVNDNSISIPVKFY